MKSVFTSLFILFSIFGFAQVVTHGPIVGAVTDTSCRVFVRTSEATNVVVQLCPDAAFINNVLAFNGTTDAAKDTITIVDVAGLVADTKYYVRVLVGSTPSGVVASFETFPATGTATHQVFISGSCIYDLTDADSSMFVRAKMDHPKAFIQSGDWGYPDAATGLSDIYFSSPPTTYAVNYSMHQKFYKLRYSSPSSVGLIQSLAMDYVYDDHDFLNDNCADDATSGFSINTADIGAPKVYTQPPQGRLNTMRAYREWFPGYKLVDTAEGIYHSFRAGNCEFFVPDLRSMRTPQAAAIKNVSGQWVYQPPANYSLLGSEQLNWLLNSLQNSTATWKFIISSDAYNIAQRFCFDTCLQLGSTPISYWDPGIPFITNSGFTAVQNFADNWTGFHEDADSLLHFVLNHNIKNVFIVSGDTHNVGLDDGTNSGIPELNCGQLKKANSHDWETTQQFMGYNIWNKGGSGLCDSHYFDNTFSRIEVFGNDSVNLSAVDNAGDRVVSWTFKANEPYKYNPNYHANRIPIAANDVAWINTNEAGAIAVTNNDHDAENDALYVSLKSGPNHGTAAVNGNDAFTYQPDPNFVGKDTFVYMVCDHSNPGCNNCATASVIINVGTSSLIETANGSLSVYPNPASNVLFVYSSSLQNLEVEITDMLGKRALKTLVDGSAGIDISQLDAGNYLCSITNTRSREIKMTKLSVVK